MARFTYDADNTPPCQCPTHVTTGRGNSGIIQIDTERWCALDAATTYQAYAWNSDPAGTNRGVYFAALPADIGTYQGPATFQSLKTNDFDRTTVYDFLADMTTAAGGHAYVGERATGADLRTPAFRNELAARLDAMCVQLTKSERADVNVYWREVI